MRLAFVLQTHRSPHEIAHLVRALDEGLANKTIVISHNGSVDDCASLGTLKGVNRVLPAPGGRAQFSLLDGLFSAFRWLETQSGGYDWVIVLSGQDYPIRPLADLENRLRKAPYDGLFHHFDASRPPDIPAESIRWSLEEVETRYFFRATRLKRQLSVLDRALWKLPRHLLDLTGNYRLHTGFGLNFCRRVKSPPFGPGFRLYGSSNWLTIRRRCVQTILRFVDERPDITEHFRHTMAPDEAFPVTILANDPTIRLSTEELRYYDFSQTHNNSPATITPETVDKVLASGKYFARKFDMDAYPDVIARVDAHIAAQSKRGVMHAQPADPAFDGLQPASAADQGGS